MGNKILLDGFWQFKERGTNEWKSGMVPGCVQNDLLNLGEMPDPFYRLNEIHMMGIEKKEWIYQNEFYLDKEELNDSLTTKLVFEGIDNYSDVYMNGSYLGSTDNMFLEYSYDISSIAVEGKNKIEVVFKSTTMVMDSIEAISPDKMEATVERKRSFVRKAQYSFGWDWGPRIIQTGLWKSVYIEFMGKSRLLEPYIYTEKLEKESALLRVKAGIENFEPGKMTAEVIISRAGTNKITKIVPVEREKSKYGIDTTIEIQYPEVWYPNGLGCQPIYQVEIMLFFDGIPIDEVSVKTGIRTVKLLQENDSSGKSFIFEVNGSKVFIKGANWVPGENMLSNMTREKYCDYVALAANANMNMLRVWGGGIYESDDFYEACDEMGIMVWQDFMYSCAQYPDHLEWFQNMAQIEAVSAVKRLRNHPSLVLWCGNNENNWGFVDWWKNGVPKYFGNYI
jgi:beta-mannosidase